MAHPKARWAAGLVVFTAYLAATYLVLVHAESQRWTVALVQILGIIALTAVLAARDRVQWMVSLAASVLCALWALTTLPWVLLMLAWFVVIVIGALYRDRRNRARDANDA